MSAYLVQITVDTLEQLHELDALGLDLQRHVSQQIEDGQSAVSGILDDEQIQRLRALNYRVDLVADLAITGAARRLEPLETLRTIKERDRASAEDRIVTDTETSVDADPIEAERRFDLEERERWGELGRPRYLPMLDMKSIRQPFGEPARLRGYKRAHLNDSGSNYCPLEHEYR